MHAVNQAAETGRPFNNRFRGTFSVKFILASMLALPFALCFTSPSQASDWGCEVLLCAASSNPSWQDVASCRPPMEKLITAMKRPGFSWPICQGAGTGKPGYERYAECPEGWQPIAGDSVRDEASGKLPQCMRRQTTCRPGYRSSRYSGSRTVASDDGVTRVFSDGRSCAFTEFMQRPLRRDPYYFDMKEDISGQLTRFWFNLRK